MCMIYVTGCIILWLYRWNDVYKSLDPMIVNLGNLTTPWHIFELILGLVCWILYQLIGCKQSCPRFQIMEIGIGEWAIITWMKVKMVREVNNVNSTHHLSFYRFYLKDIWGHFCPSRWMLMVLLLRLEVVAYPSIAYQG